MTISKETICEYVTTRKELLLTKLKKKDTTDMQIRALSAALRELDLILGKFCKWLTSVYIAFIDLNWLEYQTTYVVYVGKNMTGGLI